MQSAPSEPRASPWRAVFLHDFWFKFLGTSIFMTLFFWAYLYLLKNPAYAVSTMPLTAVDRWISFEPLALVPYLSLWIYTSLPVMLMPERVRLIGFGFWIGAMCVLALSIFYFLPNAVPPANIDWAQYPGVAFLKNVDAAGNACPSLHVAAAVYCSFWLYWLLPGVRLGWRSQSVQWAWCATIVYSTVATRQHVSLDVLGGVVLGTVFACAARWWDRKLQARR